MGHGKRALRNTRIERNGARDKKRNKHRDDSGGKNCGVAVLSWAKRLGLRFCSPRTTGAWKSTVRGSGHPEGGVEVANLLKRQETVGGPGENYKEHGPSIGEKAEVQGPGKENRKRGKPVLR